MTGHQFLKSKGIKSARKTYSVSQIEQWLNDFKTLHETNANDIALRYNGGKLRWSLVDFDALEDMVKVLDFGAKKYSDHNWKKGLKTPEIFESMMRHMTAYMRGEDIDAESGLPHTGHILCNAMFLSYMQRFKPDFDIRYKDKNKQCCGQLSENNECVHQ